MGTSIPFKKADDILKLVLEKKSASQKIVGFAAETKTDDETLKKKFQSKPVDLLVATKVHNGLVNNAPVNGFNNSEASYRFMTSKGFVFEGNLSKHNLAHKILEFIQ
jgi:phosphopantothenoylcysteine synthetase/decarboxylase